MRAILAALSLAFVLGSFSAAVQAHCAAHVKKNDFETPAAPATPTEKSDGSQG